MKKILIMLCFVIAISLLSGCEKYTYETADIDKTAPYETADIAEVLPYTYETAGIVGTAPYEVDDTELPDLQTPFIRGFTSTRGTVANIRPLDDYVFSFLIDYEFMYYHMSDDEWIAPGTIVQIEFFIDQNTLLLMDSEPEIGMKVNVFEFIAEPGEIPTKQTAFLIIDDNYNWVHVGHFNEDFIGGNFSLFIFDDAEIIFKDGTVFEGEHIELTNRLLAVYVAMSATPAFGEPLIHGIGTNKIIILDNNVLLDF